MNYDEIFLEGYLDALEEYDCLDEGLFKNLKTMFSNKRKLENSNAEKQDTINSQAAKLDNLGRAYNHAAQTATANRKRAEEAEKKNAEYKEINKATRSRTAKALWNLRAAERENKHLKAKSKSDKIKYGAGAAAAGLAAGVAGKYLYDKFIKKDKSEEEKAKNEAFIQGYNDAYMEIFNEQ